MLTKVEVASFNGGKARYDFIYTNRQMLRGCETDPEGTTLEDSDYSITVPVLDRIAIPDSQDFEFTTTAINGTFGCGSQNGMISEVKAPTQGSTAYTYINWAFPTRCDYDSNDPTGVELDVRRRGIRTKTVKREDGSVDGTWTYLGGLYPATGHVLVGQSCSRPTYRETRVDGPVVDGKYTRQLFYNSVYVGRRSPASTDPMNSWQVTDNGLPLSKDHKIGTGTGTRFLSQVTKQCSVAGGCPKIRSKYVRYDQEYRSCKNHLGDTPGCYSVNPVPVVERTVFHDDGNKYIETRSTQHDGAGNMRTSVTQDNFEGSLRQVTQGTNYTDTGGMILGVNATTGYLSVGTPSTYLPGPTKPWILHRFDKQTRTDSGLTYVSELQFNAQGLVTCTRNWKSSGGRSAQDLVSQRILNAQGFPTSTLVAGGDTANLSTAVLCSTAGSSGQGSRYVTNHTYQHGVLASSQISGSPPFPYSYRATIDKNTGLEREVFNSSDQRTTYAYDRLGRMLSAVPESSFQLGTTTVKYSNFLGTKARIEIFVKDGATELQYEKRYFDHLGREVRNLRKRPSGQTGSALSEFQTVYDAVGRVKKTTTMQVGGLVLPSKATTFSNHDPFGRPGRIQRPDGQVEIRGYLGVRFASSIVNVATTQASTLTSVVRTTLSDALGRVIKQTTPAYDTETFYDPAGQVARVKRSGGGQNQDRYYTRDGRGFLTLESLPELGSGPGNGHFDYTRDALGNPRTTDDGLHFLTHVYDAAGRPTEVKQGSQVWQEWVYGTNNGGGNYQKGKVVTATRHNYPVSSADDWAISETYEYRGAGGQVSNRKLQLHFPKQTGAAKWATTFDQSWAYDKLGNVKSRTYPTCITTPQNGRQYCNDPLDSQALPHTSTTTWSYGLPTKVTSAYSGIWAEYSYHPNLQISRIDTSNSSFSLFDQGTNGLSRPQRIQHLFTTEEETTTLFDSGFYTYDGVGNIHTIGTDLYTYDGAGRLLSGTLKKAGAGRREDYAYDAFGNILTLQRDGGATILYDIQAAKNRMLGTVGNPDVYYDAAGNMIQVGGEVESPLSFTMEYDALNMQSTFDDITGATAGHKYSYIYGPGNYRVFVYDWATNTKHWKLRDLNGKVLREHDAQGWGHYQGVGQPSEVWTWVKDFINGPEGLIAARSNGNGRRFFHRDHLGSNRVITSGLGSFLAYRHYYPYGDEATPEGIDEPASKFTGHERDRNKVTDYMLGRTYAYPFMRFMSVDPARDGWNLYGYVQGNPMKFVDPTGRNATISCTDGSCVVSVNAQIVASLDSEAEASTAKSFKEGAESFWNSQTAIGPNGEKVTFSVNLAIVDRPEAGGESSVAMDTLEVVDGFGASSVAMTLKFGGGESPPDTGTIYTMDGTGNPSGLSGVAPHEVGHLMGLKDLYPPGGVAPSPSPASGIMVTAQPTNSVSRTSIAILFSKINGNTVRQ